MNKITNILLSIFSISVLVAVAAPVAPVSATACSVTIVGTTNTANTDNGRIKINSAGTVASATVTVSGDSGCTQPVTIVSWEAPNGVFDINNVKTQTMHSYSTQTLGVGTHTVMTSMKDCYYQIDVLNSSRATAADGSAVYQAEDHLMGWAQGGAQTCDTPEPTPQPMPTQKPTSKPQTKAAVTTLPNTGSGNILGIFAGVTLSGALLHALVTKKRLGRI